MATAQTANTESMRRVAELHIIEAMSLALGLLASADMIIPSEWKEPYQEKVIVDVVKFVAHVRHLMSIADIDGASIKADVTSKKVTNPEAIDLIDRYDYALNYIMHAKELMVSWSIWEGQKKWVTAKEEVVMQFLRIETDRYESKHLSIFGLAYAFLIDVIPAVKKKHPTWQFR